MAFNDVSARDLQMQVSQWTVGKAIDTFAPCGPALVTMMVFTVPEADRIPQSDYDA
jgi:acylpyruvate hydrolase